MPEWLDGWPVGWVYAFFVAGAFVRSQATYWAGRGVTVGVLRSRWADRVDSPRMRRATEAIERWGMPIVPLSFLTVGFQTAVNAAAGLLRIGWLRYTLWALPGCLLWALVWAGGGMAAAAGVLALAAQSPALLGAVVVAAGLLVVVLLRRRTPPPTEPGERAIHHPGRPTPR